METMVAQPKDRPLLGPIETAGKVQIQTILGTQNRQLVAKNLGFWWFLGMKPFVFHGFGYSW